ncbi:MAG: histidine kinase dimerization/phospho-acceptor domain-containing protein [Planctomycetota bacterium]
MPELDLPEDVLELFAGDGQARFYFIIWRGDGELLHKADSAPDIPFPDLHSTETEPLARLVRQRGDLREVIHESPYGANILVGRSIHLDLAQQQRFVALLAASGCSVLLVGLFGGWWLSTRAIRPIKAITSTAQGISAKHLSERIDVQDADAELGQLASVLNSMFDRLEAAFGQQVRFTADAAHELRTPLSVIGTNTEHALSKDRSADEYRVALESCQRASKRMQSLIDDLLTLARIDSGELSLESALSENWITLACQGREAFGQLDDFSWQMPLSGNGR